jgi:transposase
MISITPEMRVKAVLDPVDGRKGIDGLSQVCRAVLKTDPRSGTIFLFRNRSAKTIRLLMFDGSGFWLAMKRLSQGTFRHWPSSPTDEAGAWLCAHEFRALIFGGNPATGWIPPMWRPVPLAGELRPS